MQLTNFRREHLLVLGRDEHGRDADQLQLLTPDPESLDAEIPVEDGDAEVESFLKQIAVVLSRQQHYSVTVLALQVWFERR